MLKLNKSFFRVVNKGISIYESRDVTPVLPSQQLLAALIYRSLLVWTSTCLLVVRYLGDTYTDGA